jgi:hypothetical protein
VVDRNDLDDARSLDHISDTDFPSNPISTVRRLLH